MSFRCHLDVIAHHSSVFAVVLSGPRWPQAWTANCHCGCCDPGCCSICKSHACPAYGSPLAHVMHVLHVMPDWSDWSDWSDSMSWYDVICHGPMVIPCYLQLQVPKPGQIERQRISLLTHVDTRCEFTFTDLGWDDLQEASWRESESSWGCSLAKNMRFYLHLFAIEPIGAPPTNTHTQIL